VVPVARQVHEVDRHCWLHLRDAEHAALPAPVRTLLRRIAGLGAPSAVGGKAGS
jgi:hypothetical protein